MPPFSVSLLLNVSSSSAMALDWMLSSTVQNGYWFGFESEIQKAEPVFKAKGIMERCQNTQSPQINTDKSS